MIDLVLDDHDRILSVLANAYELLRHSPEWQGVWAWDRVRKCIAVIGNAPMVNAPKPGEHWEYHHTSRVNMWLQEHGLYRATRRMTWDAILMIAHEHEIDGLLPLDTWLPLLERITQGRLRVVARHLIAELTGKPVEWVNRADELRLARCLTALGFVRRRGTGKAGQRFWHYVRDMPVKIMPVEIERQPTAPEPAPERDNAVTPL